MYKESPLYKSDCQPSEVTFIWRKKDGTELAKGAVCSGEGATGELLAPAHHAELELIIPLRHVKGLWMPGVNRNTLQRVTWTGEQYTAPFYRAGLLAFVDGELTNCFALHVLPIEGEGRISWQINQRDAVYHLKVTWGHCDQAGIRYSTSPGPVSCVISRLAEMETRPAPDLPAPAFEPSYCTWYAFHGALEQTGVEAYAKLASELGFGSFILDDGWEYDSPQRVCGALGKWHRFHGDYEPSRAKFPNFKEFFEYLGSLSLRRILWVAPYIFGESSRVFDTLNSHMLPSWLDEGFRVADPTAPEIQQFLTERLSHLAREYAIDGFKSDYDYALYGPAMRSYGFSKAYCQGLGDLISTIRRIKPDFEWILSPGIFGHQVTNVFRCHDVPYDPETNRLSLTHFKPLVGKAAMHYDPSLWRSDDSLTTVYRHMIPSIFCIPSLGADIMALPESHLAAIRGTLAFYRRHQEILNHGDFSSRWAASDHQSFHTKLGRQEIGAAFSAYPVTFAKNRKAWLVNASYENRVTLSLASSARLSLETLEGKTIAQEARLNAGLHEVPCEAGTVLVIETM